MGRQDIRRGRTGSGGGRHGPPPTGHGLRLGRADLRPRLAQRAAGHPPEGPHGPDSFDGGIGRGRRHRGGPRQAVRVRAPGGCGPHGARNTDQRA
eukprot:11155924-Lingulodinium_polyedra.AAC.1